MTNTRPVPPPGMEARRQSWCARCDEPINRGDRYVYSHGHPIHVACANGQDDDG